MGRESIDNLFSYVELFSYESVGTLRRRKDDQRLIPWVIVTFILAIYNKFVILHWDFGRNIIIQIWWYKDKAYKK